MVGMSFSKERLSPQQPIKLNDREIREATEAEIDRLGKLQDQGCLSSSGQELLETLQRDCFVHDF